MVTLGKTMVTLGKTMVTLGENYGNIRKTMVTMVFQSQVIDYLEMK
jgi:hypothetical protein